MSDNPHQLDVRARREPDATIVTLSGEVDLRTSPQLRNTFHELLESRPSRIIIDLSDVSYVDSSGVGTIVELKRRAMRNGGDVILVGLQTRVRSVFEITRLDKFFTIAKDVDEARKA